MGRSIQASRGVRVPLLICLLSSACAPEVHPPLESIPIAASVTWGEGWLSLGDGVSAHTDDVTLTPLATRFEEDFHLLTGLPREVSSGEVSSPRVLLSVDSTLAEEEYLLGIGTEVSVAGGSYRAVALGLTTLLQSLNDRLDVPRGTVRDRARFPYRGVMLDLARAWHDVSTIKEVIDLARWYKLNYVHLHLTDDQSFTFPSTAYPELSTPGRSYSLVELEELNAYAYERGVTLVPEIDVPGHATQLVARRPDLFRIGDSTQNDFTITMGREAAYAALDTLIGEVADVFVHSPYIHIGGDEAFFGGMDADPESVAYMAEHGLANSTELFRHFLIRMNAMVTARGRRTIVWAGFSEEGTPEIPRDIIVMHWEPQYYNPQRLIDAGFDVINASFKPLYVVNNRTWAPRYILEQWNVRRWESWTNDGDFRGFEVTPSPQILGGSMSAWEQHQANQLPRLRTRVPVMSEHLWSQTVPTWADHAARHAATDTKLERLLRPFAIREVGMRTTTPVEGLFMEHRWFDSTTTVDAISRFPGFTLRYSLSGPVDPTSAPLTGPLTIDASATLRIQAYDEGGQPIGLPLQREYLFNPLFVRSVGLERSLPLGSWEKPRFEDSATLELGTAKSDLTVRYTLDGSSPGPSSAVVQGPITIDQTTTVRARPFDSANEAVGIELRETYYQIVDQHSLTTGKPTSASNGDLYPDGAAFATDGRVTLWEQWGGHVDDHVWVAVDLETVTPVRELRVHNFWDGTRYYQYTIEGSLDGERWMQLVDFSDNTRTASIEGYVHEIDPTQVRHLRINLLYNSANPGLHLVEFGAFN